MPSVSGEGRRRSALEEAESAAADRLKEKCPRCESRDTKFCYYNNYNTSQPRHFCKSCRRYWTLGGSLRNVPVGGSSRKRLRPCPSVNPPSPRFDSLFSGPLPTGFLALGEPFRFELGLRSAPGPSVSIEEMGFGLGPTLLFPSSLLDDEVSGGGGHTWRMESGVGECFAGTSGWKDLAVSAPADGSGGTNNEVH